MSDRLWIKICGVTHAEHIHAAAEGDADLVGLVLWPGSPRWVAWDRALALAEVAHSRHLESVALVVDPDDAVLDAIAAEGGPFDRVQFHGSEPCARLARSPLPTIKGFAHGTTALAEWEACPHAAWLLLDGPRGGGGAPFDHRELADARRRPTKPWLVAGGLTAETVAAVVSLVQPSGVDVSSGVERERGCKDPDLIQAFCRAAREV